MAEFNNGDLVQLKSGGPKMVVDSMHTPQFGDDTRTQYRCKWFSGAKHNSETFHADALQSYQEDS